MADKNEKIKTEEVTTINELAVIMRDSFQSNQEYMDKKFEEVDKNFKILTEKVNNISLNIVDVVRKEEFDKLESRVVGIEETMKLSPKAV